MTTWTSCIVIRPRASFLARITFLIRCSFSLEPEVSGPRVSLMMSRMASQAITVLSNISGTQNAIQVA